MKSMVLLLVSGALECWGADWCAIRVTAKSVDGHAVRFQAKLLDQSNMVVAATGPAQGSITFCDIPFGPHSIRVEADRYFPSSIHDVQIRFGETQHLIAVMNSNDIGDGTTNACPINFRVLDEQGKGLANATLTSGSFKMQADAYGRFLTGLVRGRNGEFTLAAPNHGSKTISLQCQSLQRIQQVVVLSPEK